ncbi:hypothetical protein [Pseudomonas putida]
MATVTGDDSANILNGTSRSDTLNGRGGNDTLNGGTATTPWTAAAQTTC